MDPITTTDLCFLIVAPIAATGKNAIIDIYGWHGHYRTVAAHGATGVKGGTVAATRVVGAGIVFGLARNHVTVTAGVIVDKVRLCTTAGLEVERVR